ILLTLLVDSNLRKSQNIFIGSLAVADLFVASVTMPSSIVGVLFGEQWYYEHYAACVFAAAFCAPSCVASMHSIAWVAISRYFYIARPQIYNNYFTAKHFFCYTVAIWLLSVAGHLPNHFGWGTVHVSQMLYYCTVDTELQSYRLFYASLLVLAIVIAFVFYARIYAVLRKSTLAKNMILRKSGMSNADINSKTRMAGVQEETKMIKATFRIFILFFIFWAPIATLFLLNVRRYLPAWVYMYAALLAHCNSTLNFFIYFLQNDNFSKALKKMLPFRLRRLLWKERVGSI
uniref:G-protein coupled receptors family 1 profile domain-containing protein n=1 Tax=Romanomermis culicivorax TaxID=13658 RepID=A0A915JFF5_ROMCU